MFGLKRTKSTIDSLIGASAAIEGNIQFKGGLRIDGQVNGHITAEMGEPNMLVISEHAKIKGDIRAAHIVVNGEIDGPVYASELLELQPQARINGNVFYKTLEMHGGAVVSGKLTHEQKFEEPVLKLATANSKA